MPSRTRPALVRRLVFGINAHGLGHLTRACQLANALAEIDPTLEFHFWTDFPRDRIASELKITFQHRRVAYEPGTAQRTCFELDVEQTVEAYQVYLRGHDERVAVEREALRNAQCDAVICDVPALLVRAASELGIPTIAVSNFTWDWILKPILEGTPAEAAIGSLHEDYRSGAHHIRLPFGPNHSPFSSTEEGALISRRAELSPDRIKTLLGFPSESGKPIALVCPGGWDPEGWQPIHPDTEGYDLVLVGDLPVRRRAGDLSLPHALAAPIRFPDLVNAVDVVLAKPGYGIASECVTHRTPLVTIDRPGFRETPLLRRELAKLGPSTKLGLDDFFDGCWTGALDAALACSTPWAPLAERSDLDVARRVLSALGWR